VRDLSDVSVGVDLDGDGAIRDLLGNGVVPGDEVLFDGLVERHEPPGVDSVEPTARLFFTLPGAVSEMNDSAVATISDDGTRLNVQGSGSCSSEAPASGVSFARGRHEFIFRMGGPGTFRATGTIEIPAKKQSATIVVKPIADGLAEGPETIEIELVPNEDFAPGAVSSATIELLSKE
jgi:hypothetical protein